MSLYSLLCPLPGGEQDRDKSGFPPSQRKCSNPFTEKCWMVGFTGLNCALAGCETLHSSQNIKFCESKVKYRIQGRSCTSIYFSLSGSSDPGQSHDRRECQAKAFHHNLVTEVHSTSLKYKLQTPQGHPQSRRGSIQVSREAS